MRTRCVRLSFVSRRFLCRALIFVAGALFESSVNPTVQGEEPTTKAAPGELQWSVESSHAALPAAGQNFWVRLRLHAPERTDANRELLNLSVVIDRSASMNVDAKIGFVRQAGHILTDNLTPDDYISLVAYNHEVQLLVPMHPVVNREFLHHRIDELTAAGNTNISAGFLEGCAQLESRLREPGQHHVLLLTDGLANRGVTDPRSLVALVQRAKQRGIGVTTIGVGADFNESLLTQMSQAGGGHYAYAANADQIPTAVEKELGSLLAVAAQNVNFKMKLPTGIEVVQVYGHEEELQPDLLEKSLGDLTSGEERRLLIKCRVAPAFIAKGSEPFVLRAELNYDNLAAAQRSHSEQTIAFEQQAAAPPANQTATNPVLGYAQLVEDVDKIALAVKSMDRNLAGEVLRIRDQQFPALKKLAYSTGDQDFVNKAFMFEYYSRELGELIENGALHDHSVERAQLQKDLQYRRYMSDHHRGEHVH